ncbi:MAG: hypothetical protein AB7Q17_04550 [Phycisphaerae bacterium]
MVQNQLLFWILAFSGCVLSGWWLAIRPGAICRDVGTPVAFLVILMAVLLCVLALTGQDVTSFLYYIYNYSTAR